MRLAIVIPCFNVELVIKETINRILRCKSYSIIKNIIFLDNASNDNTSKIIKNFKHRNKKFIFIQNKNNLGYGGSIKVGLNFIERNNFSHFIIIHSDNQTNISSIIDNFVKLYLTKSCDFIIASRFFPTKKKLTKKYNLSRNYVNLGFNFLFKNILNINQTDIGSGIIFLSKKILKKINYDYFDNEMLFHIHLNLVINDFDIVKKEIPLVWRDSKVKSNTNDYKIGLQILLLFFIFFIKKKNLNLKKKKN